MLFSSTILPTAIDYPGHPSFTVFTVGCNLDCEFCHNKALIHDLENRMNVSDVLHQLKRRAGLFDHLTITGGEPCMHRDELVSFCEKVKEMGFNIKLDTNGLYPSVLSKLIQRKLVDYVAMDFKTDPAMYGRFLNPEIREIWKAKVNYPFLVRLGKSILALRDSDIAHEYRTTPTPKTCEPVDFMTIGNNLTYGYIKTRRNGRLPVWFIQKTRPVKDVVFELYSTAELEDIVLDVQLRFPDLDVRLR